jgi:uncharacterized protein
MVPVGARPFAAQADRDGRGRRGGAHTLTWRRCPLSLDITPSVPSGRQVIQGYRGGIFRISDVDYRGPVIVFPERTVSWGVVEAERLVVEDLTPVLEAGSRVLLVLLGCGATMRLPPPAVRNALKSRGISLEPMDTGAACRTFNVLVGEDRQVAAALIPTA